MSWKVGWIRSKLLASGLLILAWQAALCRGQELVPPKAEGTIRIATYNGSLNRPQSGQLEQNLRTGDSQATRIAAVIRAVQPDILLLNELDYSETAHNAKLFAEQYLASTQPDTLDGTAWPMRYIFDGPVNTGVTSSLDLNGNHQTSDPEDCWGYGRFPGQYGMAVFSRYQIDVSQVRDLRQFRWTDLPAALRPTLPDGAAYYDDNVWSQLRLSSKSHWDVPVLTPLGTIHVLASHPTPPAFDGPEDRNGCRNHDEIRLLQYYMEGTSLKYDGQRRSTGLRQNASFVILGDLNSDPQDGGSKQQAIADLLTHSRVAQFAAPSSSGALAAAQQQGGVNSSHVGDARHDTADFSDRSVGNLRVDYVLPSADLHPIASGVFWPDTSDIPPPLRDSVQQCLTASDHHLVWIDVAR